MRGLQVVLGLACCSAAPLGSANASAQNSASRLLNRDVVPPGGFRAEEAEKAETTTALPPPGKYAKIDCTDGRVYDLGPKNLIVKSWSFSGSGTCTLLGGQLSNANQAGAAALIARMTVSHGATLIIQGTKITNIWILVDNSFLETHGVTFNIKSGEHRRGIQALAVKACNSSVALVDTAFAGYVADEGGAVFLSGGSLSVVGCRFKATAAKYAGGAIYGEQGAVITIAGSQFIDTRTMESGESTTAGGGAIAIVSSTLLISDCSFTGTCSRQRGGAVLAEGDRPNVTIEGSTFKSPKAGVDCFTSEEDFLPGTGAGLGGAVAVTTGFLSISDSRFEDAYARTGGGAIYAASVAVTIGKVVVLRSHSCVGGVFYQRGGSLDITGPLDVTDAKARVSEDTISKDVDSKGGVIAAFHATVTVRHAQVFNAYAAGDGGAIWMRGGTLTIGNMKVRQTKSRSRGGFLYGIGSPVSFDLVAHGLTLTNCKADSGGCIFIDHNVDGKANITGSSFTFTTSREAAKSKGGVAAESEGGALFFGNMEGVILEDVNISRSQAAGDGGAIAISKVKSATIRNLMVVNSLSGQGGGAIAIGRSTVYIDGLQVSSVSARLGGALMLSTEARVAAQQVILYDTVASSLGGALHIAEGSDLACEHLMIRGARAVSQGGAIYARAATVNVMEFDIGAAEAGLGGAYIFAVSSSVNLEAGAVRPKGTVSWANLFTFSRSTIRFTDIQVTKPLLGYFAALESSQFLMNDVAAECSPHSEFVDRKTKYDCSKCLPTEGIIGISRVGNESSKPKKCYTCPENSEGCKDEGCLCKTDFVLNNTEPGSFAAMGSSTCVSCSQANLKCPPNACGDVSGKLLPPLVLNCPKGSQQCRQVWANPGFWRDDRSFAAAVECPYKPACVRMKGKLCPDGYGGPMCMVCQAGHYRNSRFRQCRSCNETTANDILFYSALVCVCAVVIGGFIYMEKVKDMARDVSDTVYDHTSYIRVKAKQVAFIMQAASTLQELRFPASAAVNATSGVLPIVSLDVFASKHIAKCRMGMDAFDCYFFLLAQVAACVAAIFLLWKRCGIEADWLVLTVYNFMLMSVVKASLSFFLCDDDAKAITGATYLNIDYSIECTGARYHFVCLLAGITMFAWCLGIPGFLFWRMYKRRHQLNPRIKAPVGATDATADEQVQAVFTQMSREYNEAMRCYGLSAMLHLTEKQKKTVDTGNVELSWSAERAPSNEDLRRISSISAGSTLMRLDMRALLKQGLRAVEERRHPSLKAYRNFYKHYNCERWYYEFISIGGRIGYALVMMLPASLQCLAGLLLSGLLLLLLCLLMPFRRRSDNYVAAVCYMAMLGLFGSHSVPTEHEHFLNFVSGACLTFPVCTLTWYFLRAYALPGRDAIWTAERADDVFDEEFARSRLAPRIRRQQQGVELVALQSAGLVQLKGKKKKEEEEEEEGGTSP